MAIVAYKEKIEKLLIIKEICKKQKYWVSEMNATMILIDTLKRFIIRLEKELMEGINDPKDN